MALLLQNIFSNTLKLNLSKKEKNSENYNADFTKKRGKTGAKLGKLCKIPPRRSTWIQRQAWGINLFSNFR